MRKVIILMILICSIIPIFLLSNPIEDIDAYNSIPVDEGLSNPVVEDTEGILSNPLEDTNALLPKGLNQLIIEIEEIKDKSKLAKELYKKYLTIVKEHENLTTVFLNQKSSCVNLENIYEKQQEKKELDSRVIKKQNKNVEECYESLKILASNYEESSIEFQELKKSINKLNNLNMAYSHLADNKIQKYLRAYKLFSLKGNNGNLDVDSINEFTGKKEDIFCKDEIIKIKVQNLDNYYMIALTVDKNAKVIILKSERNFVRTQVMPPYGGIDRVKIFAFNNETIYNKILKYQNNNNGILSSTDINILYELLKKEKSLKDKWFTIRTIEKCER